MEQQFIVVTGDLGSGFWFTGPFDDRESAEEWAQAQDESWFISILSHPAAPE